MRALVVAWASVMVACAANGEVKLNASGSSEEGSATFSENGTTPAVASTPAAPEAAAPAPSASPSGSAEPAPAAAGCPVVCNVAQKGRVPAAEEARLGGELGATMSTLRSCGQGTVRPSLTLRFDSTSTLTGFGVDAEGGNEGSCVDAVRHSWPSVTFQGPATLRCAERCAGERAPRARSRRR